MKNTAIVVKFSTHRGLFFRRVFANLWPYRKFSVFQSIYAFYSSPWEILSIRIFISSVPVERGMRDVRRIKCGPCIIYWVSNIYYLFGTDETGKKRTGECVTTNLDELWIHFIHLHEWWCLWDVLNMCEKRYFHGRIHREYFQITWAAFT